MTKRLPRVRRALAPRVPARAGACRPPRRDARTERRPAAPRRRGAETALRAAVEHAERALSDDDGGYSVSRTHDAALELARAARALLNELENEVNPR